MEQARIPLNQLKIGCMGGAIRYLQDFTMKKVRGLN